jgi:hypothetical protein
MHRTSFVMLAGIVLALSLFLVGATRGPAHTHVQAREVPVAHAQP